MWDTRAGDKGPLHSSRQHSHWVWAVRYNSYHDQLLLTAGSDSRLVLTSLASLSSEPYGAIVEEETRPQLEDGVMQVLSHTLHRSSPGPSRQSWKIQFLNCRCGETTRTRCTRLSGAQRTPGPSPVSATTAGWLSARYS